MERWISLVLVFIAHVNAQVENQEEWRTVRITQGTVRGRFNTEYGIYAFYDIPYATVPTGPERFKAPRPPPLWVTPFDAVDRNIMCPQLGGSGQTQEDCLVASVYVPNTLETNLPVAVNIHGGAYQFTHGNTETLNSLVASNKIIAVTFNYRLGVHGFLCLGTEDAPGNAGLKDQVALLRWVKQNIASFGGNPEDVTILGCSAGGGSVDLLTLSPATKGLFNKAIVESGVSTGSAGVQIDPIENAKTYARLLNFTDVENIDSLVEFYKTAPFETLIEHAHQIWDTKSGVVTFAPCIEKDLGQERVLDDVPINIIKKGNYAKIPLLYGFSDLEGVIKILNFGEWKESMNNNFSEFLPGDLIFESEEKKEEIAQIVYDFYFGDQTVSEETLQEFANYFTDQMFVMPMLRQLPLRIQSLNDTIYLFKYSFQTDDSPISMLNLKGAGHCEQAVIVRDENEDNLTQEYKEMKTVMREMWLNFIITGKPVPEGSELPSWPPTTAARKPYMSLERNLELKNTELREDNVVLWENIYENYNRNPSPPLLENSSDRAIASAIPKILIACIAVFYVVNM